MTTALLRCLFVCAVLPAASCAARAPAWARVAAPTHVTATVAIPTSWDAGLPIVEATIDGHGPLRFLLDSGASGLFIDRRVAGELKLEPVDLTLGGAQAPTFSAGEGNFTVRDAARI